MVKTPTSKTQKPSKLEGIKESSNFLREPLASELPEDTTHISKEAFQILKFHGSYQQDNRDNRQRVNRRTTSSCCVPAIRGAMFRRNYISP